MTEPAVVEPAGTAPTEPATPPVTPPAEPVTPPADTRIAPPAEPAPVEGFKIPDAYKDKPWAAKVKSEEDLYKQIDSAQALIGKKTVAPDFATATPKEIEDFYNGLRPADKAEYKFTDDTPAELVPVYADMMHKNGISAHQANALTKEFNEIQQAQIKVLYDPAGFDKVLETSFGKDYKTHAGEVARNISANLNDADKKILETLPNEQLGLVYRYADKLIKAYGATESGAQVGGEGKVPAMDVEATRKSLRSEIHALSGRPHTAEEKAAIQAKLDATYKS